jgi:hypothetical protein
MNVSQMVCHVSGAFRMALGEHPVEQVRSLLRGPHGRYLGLYSGLPWGRNIKTVPELDLVRLGVAPAELSRELGALRDVFERFCGASELIALHPLFGRMTRKDWMRWGFLHTDHHLRQFGR